MRDCINYPVVSASPLPEERSANNGIMRSEKQASGVEGVIISRVFQSGTCTNVHVAVACTPCSLSDVIVGYGT
jgi:hypothetical protein